MSAAVKKLIDNVLIQRTFQVIRERKATMVHDIANGTFHEQKTMRFMDTLIYQQLKDPTSLTEENIREEVDTFMVAGNIKSSSYLIIYQFLRS